MKIFAIRELNNDIGYLFYYEKTKQFFIELLDGLDEYDVPLYLSSLYKKNIKSINSYYSKVWVSQRIIPSDRQNIGQILRDNNLKSYDEFNLLVLANGRCEQDNFYISSVNYLDLPKEIKDRFEYKIDDVIFKDNNLLCCFRNGKIKEFNLNEYFENNIEFKTIINNNYIKNYKLMTDGYGIEWDLNLYISDKTLYDLGRDIILNNDIITKYIESTLLSTKEVMMELNCTRQYINELVKMQKLNPIKSFDKNTLFIRKDINKIKWI